MLVSRSIAVIPYALMEVMQDAGSLSWFIVIPDCCNSIDAKPSIIIHRSVPILDKTIRLTAKEGQRLQD